MRSTRRFGLCISGLLAITGFANAGIIVTGTDGGVAAHVKVFDAGTLGERLSFLPYGAGFTGGVRVAAGDVNNDGTPDIITGAGRGGLGHVKVFDGTSGAELRSFFAYGPSLGAGVFVGSGDVDGDGWDDIVTGQDPDGDPHVKIFSGRSGEQLGSWFAYDPAFVGGVRVAAGDVTGDGRAELFTGNGGGGLPGSPQAKVFGLGGNQMRDFWPYGDVQAGMFIAGGDVSGDGLADLVTGIDSGYPSHVKVFDGATNAELRSFFAYDPAFTGGVRVAAGDLDGDGRADLVTGTGVGAAHVKVFDGATGAQTRSFFPYAATFSGGVFVAAAIPEPGTLATLGLGLIVLVRRRNKT